MSSSANRLLPRPKSSIWKLVASGDNSVDIIQCSLPAQDIRQAAAIANDIAYLLVQGELVDTSTKDTELRLRAWSVEVIMSAPRGAWRSAGQRDLAARIAARFN